MVCFLASSSTCQCTEVGRMTQAANQYALHTSPGCSQPQGVLQTGVSGPTDCSQPSGCTVTETSTNSYGESFAAAGGGVWAAQFDVAGLLYVNSFARFQFFVFMFRLHAASGSGVCASSFFFLATGRYHACGPKLT